MKRQAKNNNNNDSGAEKIHLIYNQQIEWPTACTVFCSFVFVGHEASKEKFSCCVVGGCEMKIKLEHTNAQKTHTLGQYFSPLGADSNPWRLLAATAISSDIKIAYFLERTQAFCFSKTLMWRYFAPDWRDTKVQLEKKLRNKRLDSFQSIFMYRWRNSFFLRIRLHLILFYYSIRFSLSRCTTLTFFSLLACRLLMMLRPQNSKFDYSEINVNLHLPNLFFSFSFCSTTK